MRKANWSIRVVTLAAFAAASIACGGFVGQIKQGVEDTQNLQFVGALYQTYVTTKNRAPTGPDDLLNIATSQPEKDAVKAIKDGKLTVNWNINLDDNSIFPLGKSQYLIAYAASPVGDSRIVVTADTLVVTLKEADFQTKSKNTPGPGGKK